MSLEVYEQSDAQLAERVGVRAEAIRAWATLALEQPNPVEWTNVLVGAALEKLETTPEMLPVKAEARLQLLDIQRAIHELIVERSPEPRLVG
jgi:hypothetical protein